MLPVVAQLSQSISEAVSILQHVCTDADLPIPSLQDNFTKDSESFRTNVEAAKAADRIVAASYQLIALLQNPSLTLLQTACGHIESAALRVCVESSIVEILREGGDQGLHVTEVATRSGIEAGKLGRLLRYLASHHIFSQIRPDVYVNNRISSVLDSKKPVKHLLESPESKYDGSTEQSFSSLIELFASDLHLSSGHLTENLKDPITGQSEEPNHAPFNRAFGVDVSLFEWYNQPNQAKRLRRFLTAMEGSDKLQADDGLLNAINWNELPPGSLVVDVGGGWGKASIPLARQNPHLRFIIQDKADLTAVGRKAWEVELGQSDVIDRVSFQVHDFFSSQPITNASVLILKHILHAFSNNYAIKILKNLRVAASPSTQLLIIDTLIPQVHPPQDSESASFNYDPAVEMAYLSDLTMMLQLNAQERNLSELKSLLEVTGWKVTQVCGVQGHGNLLRPVKAVPI